MYTIDDEEKAYERDEIMNELTNDESNEDIDTEIDIYSSGRPNRENAGYDVERLEMSFDGKKYGSNLL